MLKMILNLEVHIKRIIGRSVLAFEVLKFLLGLNMGECES